MHLFYLPNKWVGRNLNRIFSKITEPENIGCVVWVVLYFEMILEKKKKKNCHQIGLIERLPLILVELSDYYGEILLI